MVPFSSHEQTDMHYWRHDLPATSLSDSKISIALLAIVDKNMWMF